MYIYTHIHRQNHLLARFLLKTLVFIQNLMGLVYLVLVPMSLNA